MGEELAAVVLARLRRIFSLPVAALLAGSMVIDIGLAGCSGGLVNALVAPSATPVSPTAASARLSAAPLGVNVGPWDYSYAADTSVGGDGNIMQPLLKAAGINQLRYGGGEYADRYDWQTNTNIGNCLPNDATASFTSSCAQPGFLSFSQFSQRARAIDAESFVTVNYGSGMPAKPLPGSPRRRHRVRLSPCGRSVTRAMAAGR